nr:hypothetical protein [Tanacetum cinerariifolium]
NALQTLLPQIRVEIHEEFRTSSGPSDAGGNPPPVTIHTWLECFNKQKPHSFDKATAPVDAENWISHMEKIFDVMGCEDAFKTRLAVYKFEGNALAWWKAYKQTNRGDAWFLRTTTFLPLRHVSLFMLFMLCTVLYPFSERYAQPYFFSCLIRQGSRCVFPTFPIVFRPFKTLCFFNYALMIRQDYDITSSLRRGALQFHFQKMATLVLIRYKKSIGHSIEISLSP